MERHGITTEGAGALLTGSISEGLGSPSSDVAILVLAEKQPERGTGGLEFRVKHATEFLSYHDGVEINIEVVDRPAMRHVLSSFVQMGPALYDPSKLTAVPLLPYRERRILHRLRTGWPLRGHRVVETWRDEFFTELFPTYMTITRFIGHRELFEDVVAHVDAEDGTFSLAARDSAIEALWCFLAMRGVTGQTNKWAARYAARLTGDDRAVVERIMPLVFPQWRPSKPERLAMVEQLQQFSDYLLDLLRADPELGRATGYLLSRIHYTA
jgi:hypothetical protein